MVQPDIPWLAAGGSPTMLAPCPAGWHERTGEGSAPWCEPFEDEVVASCEPGDARFVGEAACAPIGGPCPAGDFATDLPTDRPVLYVLEGAPAGGDGTASQPYASLRDFAFGGLSASTVIALGRGRYEGPVRLTRITLWGACAAQSELWTSEPHAEDGLVTVAGPDVEIKRLRLGESPRPGVWAVGPGRSLRLEDVEVTQVRAMGMYVLSGAAVTADGLVVRDTQADPGGRFGRGITVGVDASAELSRVVFERNRGTSVVGFGEGTRLVLQDAIVRDAQGLLADGTGGRGVGIETGARAEVSRALIADNRVGAIFVGAVGAHLVLEDAVVRDTLGQDSDGSFGTGLTVQDGASAEVSRVLFARNLESGVISTNPGSEVALTDVIVRDTESRRPDLLMGRGLVVQREGSATVLRASFERNREIAVGVSGPGARLTMSDVLVRDTRSRAADDAFGRALGTQDGGWVEVSRGVFDHNRNFALLSVGSGAEMTLEDSVISNTVGAECLDGDCPDGTAGTSLAAIDGGVLGLTRFAIRDAVLCGLMVAQDGEADLSEGEIVGCEIGACLQVDGYDVTRLQEGVRYRDNGTNLQATMLPVPAAIL